jgi:hypothetical protein
MNPLSPPRIRHLWRALCVLVPLACTSAQPRVVTADDLTVSTMWARATAPNATVGAAYLVIENRGKQLDTLLRAASPVAGEVTFHRTTQADGVAHMDQLWTVDLPPGRTVKFEPNGRHIMLTNLKQPLVAGTPIPITLQFQHAGAVTIELEVVPLTASGPTAPDAGH